MRTRATLDLQRKPKLGRPGAACVHAAYVVVRPTVGEPQRTGLATVHYFFTPKSNGRTRGHEAEQRQLSSVLAELPHSVRCLPLPLLGLEASRV